jgi:hypothetical protein
MNFSAGMFELLGSTRMLRPVCYGCFSAIIKSADERARFVQNWLGSAACRSSSITK